MKVQLNSIPPRVGFAVMGVTALLLVAASVVLTAALELAPCPLCIFQRMLYLLLAVLALVAAAWPRALRWSGSLALFTGLGGLVTAGYQSWIQAFPPDTLACGPGNPGPIEQLVQWAGNLIPSLFSAWGDCGSPEWELFGLSIANLSLLAFLGLGIMALALLRTGTAGHRRNGCPPGAGRRGPNAPSPL